MQSPASIFRQPWPREEAERLIEALSRYIYENRKKEFIVVFDGYLNREKVARSLAMQEKLKELFTSVVDWVLFREERIDKDYLPRLLKANLIKELGFTKKEVFLMEGIKLHRGISFFNVYQRMWIFAGELKKAIKNAFQNKGKVVIYELCKAQDVFGRVSLDFTDKEIIVVRIRAGIEVSHRTRQSEKTDVFHSGSSSSPANPSESKIVPVPIFKRMVVFAAGLLGFKNWRQPQYTEINTVLANTKDMAVYELLKILNLHEAKLLNQVFVEESGLQIHRIRTPRRKHRRKVPQGSEILQNELGPTRDFELLYNKRGHLIAIFPVVTGSMLYTAQIDPLYYFDLTAYNFEIPALEDPQAESIWKIFAGNRMVDQVIIQHYIQRKGLGNLVRDFSTQHQELPKHKAYSYAELVELIPGIVRPCLIQFNPEDLLQHSQMRGGAMLQRMLQPSLEDVAFSKKGSYAQDGSSRLEPRLLNRIVFPNYLTVYPPATDDHIANDFDYLGAIYHHSRKMQQNADMRMVVIGPGTGIDHWLTKARYSLGINPFEMANTRALGRLASLEIETVVCDITREKRFPFEGPFNRVFSNAPYYKPQEEKRSLFYHLMSRLLSGNRYPGFHNWAFKWLLIILGAFMEAFNKELIKRLIIGLGFIIRLRSKGLASYWDGDTGEFVKGVVRIVSPVLDPAEGRVVMWNREGYGVTRILESGGLKIVQAYPNDEDEIEWLYILGRRSDLGHNDSASSSPLSDEEVTNLQVFVHGLNKQVVRIKNSVSQIKSASLCEEADGREEIKYNELRMKASSSPALNTEILTILLNGKKKIFERILEIFSNISDKEDKVVFFKILYEKRLIVSFNLRSELAKPEPDFDNLREFYNLFTKISDFEDHIIFASDIRQLMIAELCKYMDRKFVKILGGDITGGPRNIQNITQQIDSFIVEFEELYYSWRQVPAIAENITLKVLMLIQVLKETIGFKGRKAQDIYKVFSGFAKLAHRPNRKCLIGITPSQCNDIMGQIIARVYFIFPSSELLKRYLKELSIEFKTDGWIEKMNWRILSVFEDIYYMKGIEEDGQRLGWKREFVDRLLSLLSRRDCRYPSALVLIKLALNMADPFREKLFLEAYILDSWQSHGYELTDLGVLLSAINDNQKGRRWQKNYNRVSQAIARRTLRPGSSGGSFSNSPTAASPVEGVSRLVGLPVNGSIGLPANSFTREPTTSSPVEDNVDINKIKKTIIGYNLRTCLRNSTVLMYILNRLGVESVLVGQFMEGESEPFQYLVKTKMWGEIDISPFGGDAADAEAGSRDVDHGEKLYKKTLQELSDEGYIAMADMAIIQGTLFDRASSSVGSGIESVEHSINSEVKANLSRRISVTGNVAIPVLPADRLSFDLVPDPIYGIIKIK
ncbi:MAG: hypothetical protein KJ710_03415 [Candidatus Omnitrophica bacterium]|nr:hypothetical protein [Candidatus Omnitrophota bacterium]